MVEASRLKDEMVSWRESNEFGCGDEFDGYFVQGNLDNALIAPLVLYFYWFFFFLIGM